MKKNNKRKLHELTYPEILSLSKEKLNNLAVDYGIAVPDKANLDVILSAILEAREVSKNIELSKHNKDDIEVLKEQTRIILEKAELINADWDNMDNVGREALIKEMGAKGEYLSKTLFTDKNGVVDYSSAVSTDLPPSHVINNISVRVVEQELSSLFETYDMADLVTTKQVKNGIREVFYRDFTLTDGISGSADVTIGMFNQGSPLGFSDTKLVDTDIHKGIDILSTMLNDFALNVGLFVAILNQISWAVAHPVALKFYQRFIEFLDEKNSYDDIMDFTNPADVNSTKVFLKELKNKIYALKVVNRDILDRAKKSPRISNGGKGLEYSIKGKPMVLLFNSKVSSDLDVDLVAGVFQKEAIKIDISDIRVKDFDLIAKTYSSTFQTGVLSSALFILIEKGVYENLVHYTGSTLIATPMLKHVYNYFTRVGFYERLDKFIMLGKVKANPISPKGDNKTN